MGIVLKKKKNKPRIYLIVPASGYGNRFGGKIPKQFVKLKGKEIIYHTLKKFNSCQKINSIVISVQEIYFEKMLSIIKKYNFKKICAVVKGGHYRQDSVYNALRILNCRKKDYVMIHDAVRPFISKKKINDVIEYSSRYNAVITGLKVNDTIKSINNSSFVIRTLERENVWRIQTPQMFRADVLFNSFDNAIKNNIIGTDEALLVELAGYKIKVIEGEVNNIKITTKKDLEIIEKYKFLD